MSTKQSGGSNWWIWVVAGILTAVWAVWPPIVSFYLARFAPSGVANTYETQCLLGQAYGSLNCLFAGLALLGIVYTMTSQIRETKARVEGNRQQELKRISDSTKREAELEQQARQRIDDNFEQRFFRLVDIWNSYVTTLQHPDGGDQPAKGRAALSRLWSEAEHRVKMILAGDPYEEEEANPTDEELLAEERENYRYAYNEAGGRAVLDAYFRSLYHVFRYLARSETGQPKCEYSDLVRALLSLALNCLEPEGAKFKALVEEFHLLKHLDNELKELLRSNGAFGEQAFRDEEDV